MRKIFIDCGAHCGCSVRKFLSEIAEDFEIFSFECNDYNFKYWPQLINNKSYDVIKKAVWIYNTHQTFYKVMSNRHSIGSSLFLTKVQPLRSKAEIEEIRVECIDLDFFIRSNGTTQWLDCSCWRLGCTECR